MPRSATPKTTKKTTAKKKSTGVRKPRKKVVSEDVFPVPLQPLPESFSLTPSLTHEHTTYQVDIPVSASQKPRRHLVVVFCISVIMVIIVGAWIMNLRRFINQSAEASPETIERQSDFANLKAELDSTLGEIKTQLDNLDEIRAEEAPEPTPTPENEEMKKIFEGKAHEKSITPTTSTVTPTNTPVLPN